MSVHQYVYLCPTAWFSTSLDVPRDAFDAWWSSSSACTSEYVETRCATVVADDERALCQTESTVQTWCRIDGERSRLRPLIDAAGAACASSAHPN